MSFWGRLVRIGATAVLGVVFLVVLAIQAAAIARSWGGGYWIFDCAAAVLVYALALLRRERYQWTAAAGLGVAAAAIAIARVAHQPAEPGPAMALGLALLVGAAIRRLPPLPAGAIAAGGLAVVVAGQLARAGVSSFSVTAVGTINGTAWLAAAVVGGSLRLLDARARRTAEQVRQDERLDLARELHDVAAHHITGILLQAQAAQLVARRHPEQVTSVLGGIEAAGIEALAAMRRIVGLLRDTDDAAPASPGPEQLGALVERFGRHGPPVRLHTPDDTSAWAPEVTSTVYRIVQEALTNVTRHAPHARSVAVTVVQEQAEISVEVVDDAPLGPALPHRDGYGLIGMRERVESLGGTLVSGPRPGSGWSVRATLPMTIAAPR